MATSTSTSALFQPLTLGALNLSHRLVLAPLTRMRSDKQHVPHSFVATYYEQRGCIPGTLLISEATLISAAGSGHPHAPGIWTTAQIASWKRVTAAVHARGSYIFCQLWAQGRAAKADLLKEESGLDVVAPSAVPLPKTGDVEPTVPRALREEEIWNFVEEYAQAARNAIEAGFDGVEIHGANGYLIDQFTQTNSNKREDKWGGSIENRTRFALEVAKAVCDAVGEDRVGMRLSPWSTFQGMKMDDPKPTFSHLAKALGELGLAYIHVTESRVSGGADQQHPDIAKEELDFVVEAWRSAQRGNNSRPMLLCGGYNDQNAMQTVDDKYAGQNMAIVIGRHWIANPDIVFRIKEGIKLHPYNRKTFYLMEKEEGYTDQPFSEEFLATTSAFKQVSTAAARM